MGGYCSSLWNGNALGHGTDRYVVHIDCSSLWNGNELGHPALYNLGCNHCTNLRTVALIAKTICSIDCVTKLGTLRND